MRLHAGSRKGVLTGLHRLLSPDDETRMHKEMCGYGVCLNPDNLPVGKRTRTVAECGKDPYYETCTAPDSCSIAGSDPVGEGRAHVAERRQVVQELGPRGMPVPLDRTVPSSWI